MTLAELLAADRSPAVATEPLLAALRHPRHGAADLAHERVQAEADADAARVHACLHRPEGDPDHAACWYRRAGRPLATGAFEEEWMTIARTLTDG